jgi:pimeloyl-ACP methyl ester carboxylesterase
MSETFVLLHGSWHGGWAWEPTAWCLRERGDAAYAPTYPGHLPGASRAGIRHQDYVDSVVAFIEGRDLRDVVLVGHSFGGSVVSRVSQVIPERLKRLVFHTAFVVADGASVNDEFPDDQTAQFEAAARESPDRTVACIWEVFRDLFMQDASPEEARSVWERLVPQPFAPWAGSTAASCPGVTSRSRMIGRYRRGSGIRRCPRGWEGSNLSRWTGATR